MRLTIELDEKLARLIKERAESKGKRVENFVLEMLEEQLKENRKKEAVERFKGMPAFRLGGRKITRDFIYENR